MEKQQSLTADVETEFLKILKHNISPRLFVRFLYFLSISFFLFSDAFFPFDLIKLLLVEFGCLAFTLLKHPVQIQCSFSMVHAIAGEVAAGRGT